MSSQVFVVNGEGGISGVFNTLTSEKGINTLLLSPPLNATHYVRYSSGATAALKTNEILTGGTSASTAQLIGQVVENGTAGSGDSGILFIRIISGIPTSTGEVWTGGLSSGTVTTAQSPLSHAYKTPAKAVWITAESADIHVTLDGTIPTTEAGTSVGHLLINDQSPLVISGRGNIYNFKCINAQDGNGAVVKYTVMY